MDENKMNYCHRSAWPQKHRLNSLGRENNQWYIQNAPRDSTIKICSNRNCNLQRIFTLKKKPNSNEDSGFQKCQRIDYSGWSKRHHKSRRQAPKIMNERTTNEWTNEQTNEWTTKERRKSDRPREDDATSKPVTNSKTFIEIYLTESCNSEEKHPI